MTDEHRRIGGSAPSEEAAQRRRLRGFGWHLLGYFISVTAMGGYALLQSPPETWFILPMVGWGAPLAVHAAWTMGLFDGLFGDGG